MSLEQCFLRSARSALTLIEERPSIESMKRVSIFLVFLLLVLTFNAHACILPLQQSAGMDCTSGTEEPVRGTCDAFIEIGPSSHVSPQLTGTLQLEYAVSVSRVSHSIVHIVPLAEPSFRDDTPTHLSIRTTVLRI